MKFKIQNSKSKILVLFIALACACASAAELSAYSNKEHKFEIKYPADWEKKENFNDTTVAFIAPRGAKVLFRPSVNVVAQDIPADADLAKFSDGALAVLDKLLKNYTQLEKTETTLAGVKAIRVVYSYSYEEGESKIQYDVKALLVLAVAGKKAYAITCTAETPSFNGQKAVFDEIVNSFKL